MMDAHQTAISGSLTIQRSRSLPNHFDSQADLQPILPVDRAPPPVAQSHSGFSGSPARRSCKTSAQPASNASIIRWHPGLVMTALPTVGTNGRQDEIRYRGRIGPSCTAPPIGTLTCLDHRLSPFLTQERGPSAVDE